LAANAVASLEALVGVLGFAMATGLLYGRFSRPSARLGFSRNMLVSPYGDATALEFRVVNRRSNSLMELDVRMMLMTVERSGGEPRRKYEMLRVERKQLLFLPLTWTVVHPIDTHSPFAGRTAEELDRLQAEVLILVRAYDDTFSQTVLARHSYRHDEMVWGTRFAPAFHVDGEGDLVLDLARLSETVR
jgi:inward rectifier potassium channel